MPDQAADAELDDFLAIRKPGAHLEEGVVESDLELLSDQCEARSTLLETVRELLCVCGDGIDLSGPPTGS